MKIGENCLIIIMIIDLTTLVSLRLDDDVVARWRRHLHLVLLSSPGHDHHEKAEGVDVEKDDGDGDL